MGRKCNPPCLFWLLLSHSGEVLCHISCHLVASHCTAHICIACKQSSEPPPLLLVILMMATFLCPWCNSEYDTGGYGTVCMLYTAGGTYTADASSRSTSCAAFRVPCCVVLRLRTRSVVWICCRCRTLELMADASSRSTSSSAFCLLCGVVLIFNCALLNCVVCDRMPWDHAPLDGNHCALY